MHFWFFWLLIVPSIVRKTAENAERLHADFTKGFIAFGISAGANFAAVLAIRARDDPSFMAKLTGQVLQIPYLCDPDFYPDKCVFFMSIRFDVVLRGIPSSLKDTSINCSRLKKMAI
jgi:hypothetical protein